MLSAGENEEDSPIVREGIEHITFGRFVWEI